MRIRSTVAACAALVAIFVAAQWAPYDDLFPPTPTSTTSSTTGRKVPTETTRRVARDRAARVTHTGTTRAVAVGVRLRDGSCVETGPTEAKYQLERGATLDGTCRH